MTHAVLSVLAVAICVWESVSLWRHMAECRRLEERLARDLETIDRNMRNEFLKRLH